jgi:hypothetical protein
VELELEPSAYVAFLEEHLKNKRAGARNEQGDDRPPANVDQEGVTLASHSCFKPEKEHLAIAFTVRGVPSKKAASRPWCCAQANPNRQR